MENEIIRVIKYFSCFQYAPSFDEIYKFLPLKVNRKGLKMVLDRMVIASLLHCSIAKSNNALYTLGEYSSYFKKKSVRRLISQKKINKIKAYLAILSQVPQIKFVGLSGTLAMANAKPSDDIDLFIITAKKRLWFGRFFAMFIAELLGLRRHRKEKQATDKICLNLFFDEAHLEIPFFKKTEYVAHEVLQTKPLINKDKTYERFIKVNSWVRKYFPNSDVSEDRGQKSEIGNQKIRLSGFRLPAIRFPFSETSGILDFIETVLKRLQLNIIKQHQTNEIVTDTQLWFFPEDFEKKLIQTQNKKNSHANTKNSHKQTQSNIKNIV